jgi:hypothetical protein
MPSQDASHACPGRATTQPTGFDMILSLEDRGNGHLVVSPLSVTTEVQNSCIQQLTKVDCSNIENSCAVSGQVGLGCGLFLQQVSCSASPCGLCECQVKEDAIDSDISWTSTGGTLSIPTSNSVIDGTQTTLSSYSYCVDGDTLHLATTWGIEIDLKRVQLAGSPMPCQGRTANNCTSGGGCHTGECQGGPACSDAATEATCTNRMGCNWNASACAGTEPAACRLADYGTVPGCDLLAPTASCAGTPKACEGLSAADCGSTKGCTGQPGCVGSSIDCHQYDGSCDQCNSIVGCLCGNGPCSGVATCAGQSQYSCESVTGCTWSPFVCAGTPTPCESLGTNGCTSPGCSVNP